MVEAIILLLGVGLLASAFGGGGGGGGSGESDGPLEPVIDSDGENDLFEGSRNADAFDAGPGFHRRQRR